MAEGLDDGKFWLPPQFLSDDDIFMEKTNKSSFTPPMKPVEDAFTLTLETDCFKSFPPFDFGCFGVPSDLSSPVDDSVVSSTEESDEEDYIAGLTCKMARSTLETNYKDVFLSGSPQSTLCGVGNGLKANQGSNRGGASNGFYKLSSQPATWDLLHAAAGEVAKLRLSQQEEAYYTGFDRGILGPPRKSSPVSDFGHHSYSHHKLQESQFQHLRQQQMMKQLQRSNVWAAGQMKGGGGGVYQQSQTQPAVVHNSRGRSSGRSLGLCGTAWPTVQQAHQSQNHGMRAVFLSNPAHKRECAGTGVFLPRSVGIPAEPRKKPACSTVLLPAKVVQALNLNLDDIGGSQPQLQPRYHGHYTARCDNNQLRFGSNNVVHQQKRSLRSQPELSAEIRLPQEWTY